MSPLRIDVDGHVAVLTIDRPEAANAVDRATWEALGDGLERLGADPGIRAIVLTGAGDRVFCAGADLKALAAGELFPTAERFQSWGFAGYVHHVVDVPTIAAVNGLALGGGTELVLASDLAVASEHAVFGLPEVTHGIVASGGGAFRLPAQIPRKVALELMFTGRRLGARRALELGLVNSVVPTGRALDAALELAHEIAANAPLAVRATKRLALGIAGGLAAEEEARWSLARRESRLIRETEDAREGVRAFAERRRPEWRSR